MENNKGIVDINVKTLTQQVESGMKKKDLAQHYGISELQISKAVKAAGLTFRKFHHPTFRLVTDTPVQEETTDKEEEVGEVDNSAVTDQVQEDTAQADVNEVEDENVAPKPVDNTSSTQEWS